MTVVGDSQNPLTVVRILWCGHGQLILVEIYNDGVEKAEADFLALINCGGERNYAGPALDYVRDKVAARHRKLLNLVVFTQVDLGTTELLGELGRRLKPVGARIMAGFVAATGWTGPGQADVKTFFELLAFPLAQVEFATAGQSDYLEADKPPSWIAEHNGTYLRIMATGTGLFGLTTVLVVDNGRLAVVLPGQLDETIMTAITRLPNLGLRLSPRRALVLPNDSDLESAVGAYLRDPSASNRERVKAGEDFAKALRPGGIVVSAGVDNLFDCPVKQVLDLFAPYLEDDAEHTYVCYDLPQGGRVDGSWRTETSKKGIRTTLRTYGAKLPTTYGQVTLPSRLRPPATDSEQ
jgi:hypothetical protein